MKLVTDESFPDSMELQQIYLKVHDFLNWINECERTAKSEELGSDLKHIRILQHDFNQFALRTVANGSAQVWEICDECDRLVDEDHAEVYTISLWRDETSEAWENILELIDTRMQVLEANYAWHVYMDDCKSAMAATVEKIQQWTSMASQENLQQSDDDLSTLKLKEQMRSDLATLKPLVKNVQRELKSMDHCYSGDQLTEIQSRASDVNSCWRQLKTIYKDGGSVEVLNDNNQLLTFLNKYASLRRSIDDIQEKLRGWPEGEEGVNKEELDNLMRDHKDLKKRIAAREKQLEDCNDFGSTLIGQHHYASMDVEEKLLLLNKDWVQLMHLWEQRFEKVHKMLLKSARSLDDLSSKHDSSTEIDVKPDQSAVVSSLSLIEDQKPKKLMNGAKPNANFFGGMYASLPNVQIKSLGYLDTRHLRLITSATRHFDFREADAVKPVRRPEVIIEAMDEVDADDAGTEILSYEGILFRKRLRTRHDRIAIESGWKRFYCVLKEGSLYFYTDKVKKEKGKPSKKYPPLPLLGASINTDVHLGRLKNLFSVTPTVEKTEYLFQARDEYHTDCWVRFLTRVAEGTHTNNNGDILGLSDSSKTIQMLKKASPRIFQGFFNRKKQNGTHLR